MFDIVAQVVLLRVSSRLQDESSPVASAKSANIPRCKFRVYHTSIRRGATEISFPSSCAYGALGNNEDNGDISRELWNEINLHRSSKRGTTVGSCRVMVLSFSLQNEPGCRRVAADDELIELNIIIWQTVRLRSVVKSPHFKKNETPSSSKLPARHSGFEENSSRFSCTT